MCHSTVASEQDQSYFQIRSYTCCMQEVRKVQILEVRKVRVQQKKLSQLTYSEGGGRGAVVRRQKCLIVPTFRIRHFQIRTRRKLSNYISIFYSCFEYGDVHLTGDTEGDFVVVDSFLNRGFGGSGSVEAPNEGASARLEISIKRKRQKLIFYSIFEYGDVHLTGDSEGDIVVVDSFLNRGFGGFGSIEASNEGGNGRSQLI